MAWRGSASVGGMPSDGNSFLEKAAEARIRRRRQRFLCPVSHSNGETTVAVPGLFLDGWYHAPYSPTNEHCQYFQLDFGTI
mmetsp:Transcript_52633/g.53027  ORF Transcript_52633/g.53027 Transcript_52633/m.53027 type:complete len:81 (-) Transcript_52633:459-701(-)